jgi:hypothetical protein
VTDNVERTAPAANSDSIGNAGSGRRLAWTYGQLLRIEDHRTAELQNQQTRAATILVANGLIFGFLASHVTTSGRYGVADRLELVSAALLAVAMLFGLGAVWPRTKLTNSPAFLDPAWYTERCSGDEHHVLQEACDALGALIDGNKFIKTMRSRRNLLRCQLLLIGLGSATLASAALTGAISHR